MLSTLAHLFAIVLIGTLAGKFTLTRTEPAMTIDTTLLDEPIVIVPPVDPPLDPTILNPDVLAGLQDPMPQIEIRYDDSPDFQIRGGGIHAAEKKESFGGLGFKPQTIALGPLVNGLGGIGNSSGSSTRLGSGGPGEGMGLEGRGWRKGRPGKGETPDT